MCWHSIYGIECLLQWWPIWVDGKCSTTFRVAQDVLLSGGPSMFYGAGWFVIFVFLMLMETATLSYTSVTRSMLV